MGMGELISDDQVFLQCMEDPGVRDAWERTLVPGQLSLELASFRSKHNLSQTALAKRLGMKQPQLFRLEQGEAMPTIETLSRISQELGLSMNISITPRPEAETAICVLSTDSKVGSVYLDQLDMINGGDQDS